METKDKDGNVIVTPPVVETVVDPLAELNEKLTKTEASLENYKRVALKRLGKLPGDADFLESADTKTGLTVEEQVSKILLEGEFKKVREEKDKIISDITRENSELRLAIKNTPKSTSIGSGSSEGIVEVKNNILSDGQRASLVATATRLKVDPEKFIETFIKNLKK